MGADPVKPGSVSDEPGSDRSDAPLLPKGALYDDAAAESSAASQLPVPTVTVQRDDSDSPLSKPVKGGELGEGYHTSLCDCCAEPGGAMLCCYGMWCAPCLFGQNIENMGSVRWSGEQAAPSVIPCWAAGLAFGIPQVAPLFSHHAAGTGIVPAVLQTLLRRRIRRHYQIKGHSKDCSCGACPCCCCECTPDDCADCCSSFWCTPCALCQDAREIEIRGAAVALTLPEPMVTPPVTQSMGAP